MKTTYLWLLTMLCTLFLAGCPAAESEGVCGAEDRAEPILSGDELAGEDEMIFFAFDSLDPAPPDLGQNDWVVSLASVSGSALEGCTLEARPWMPDHGHGSTDVTATNEGDGSYSIAGLEFVMPGYWTVSLSADCGSAETNDSRTLHLCIEG